MTEAQHKALDDLDAVAVILYQDAERFADARLFHLAERVEQAVDVLAGRDAQGEARAQKQEQRDAQAYSDMLYHTEDE